jgi:hypothetical protein
MVANPNIELRTADPGLLVFIDAARLVLFYQPKPRPLVAWNILHLTINQFLVSNRIAHIIFHHLNQLALRIPEFPLAVPIAVFPMPFFALVGRAQRPSGLCSVE